MADHGSALRCIAFEGMRCIVSGTLAEVAAGAKKVVDRGERAPIVIFDAASSEPVEVDFRGTLNDVLERLAARKGTATAPDTAAGGAADAPRGPGRPKLGVVAREVTLLPRHWEWLGSQPGGASVALRKLVEEARRMKGGRDRVRRSQEAAYRFMSALAGNLPGFEEAARALFAADAERFDALVGSWPADVREHARRLAAPALHRAGG
jgi:hypothetical protein